jgi:hypothetical protein
MEDRHKVPLIFVWVGKELPSWSYAALRLAIELSRTPVILLCSNSIKISIPKLTIVPLENFYQPNESDWQKNMVQLRAAFRSGFWIKTTERLLVLSQFVARHSITRFFHAELDNLVFNLSDLPSALDSLGSGLFCPRDQFDRGLASLIYVNNLDAIEEIVTTITDGKIQYENDMKVLGHLLNNSSNFFSLPNESYMEIQCNKKWQSLSPFQTRGIFDAASVGQYVLGIDPRNTGIFLYNGPTSKIINAGCDLSRLTFELDLTQGTMHLRNRDTEIALNIYNLHIHSKLFGHVEDRSKFDNILKRLNNNESTLLKISPMRMRLFRSLEYRFFNR